MKLSRAIRVLLGCLGVVGVLGAWELAARGAMNPSTFPSPTSAVLGALERVSGGDVADHIVTSLVRIAKGFGIGAVAGILIGVATGWYRLLDNLLRPTIEILRPIPPLAWIPIAIVWFGLDEASKVFVISIAAFFPVLTNTYRGVAGIDPVILRAALTMDARGAGLLFKVALPAAMPDIAIGLNVAWGLSFAVLVAAELIAADSGLGYLIMNAREFGDVQVIIFGILLIGACSLVTSWGIGLALRRWLGGWHPV